MKIIIQIEERKNRVMSISTGISYTEKNYAVVLRDENGKLLRTLYRTSSKRDAETYIKKEFVRRPR